MSASTQRSIIRSAVLLAASAHNLLKDEQSVHGEIVRGRYTAEVAFP